MENNEIKNNAAELNDEELESVAGGADLRGGVSCPMCGHEMRKVYSVSLTPSTPALVGLQCPYCCYYEVF